jgi:nucleotide-binding universal stress UspA family protein
LDFHHFTLPALTGAQENAMEICKILVGTDYSEQAEAAVEQAANLARRLDAELILLHAGTVPEYRDDIPDSMKGAAARFEALLREQLKDNRDKLEGLRERLGGTVKASHMVIDGFPDTGIVDASKEVGADLIVVGTHGRTGFKRFLMGSVAERVVRLSDTCVMVARGRGEVGAGGFRKILVPTDFSDTAERALEAALLVARPGAIVEAFHCWQLPGPVTGYWGPVAATGAVLDPLRKDLKEAVDAQGADLVARHTGAGVELIFTELEESAVHGVQQRLEQGGYDLVVMGSHGRRGLRRWMLGSVAESTVRYAPISTLVVHPEPKAKA